jgi:Ser/Thr protein kinase RdoA (MazF antagonist)
MKDFLKNWDIGDVAAIEPIHSYSGKVSLVKTIRNHCYILKEKSNLIQVDQESKLLSSLYEAGAPVAVPIRTVDAKWYTWAEGKIFCLYPKLPGYVIAEHYAGNAIRRAEMLGKAIGFLHSCFLKCQHINDYADMQLLEQVRNWAIPCIKEHTTILEGNEIEKIWDDIEQEINPVHAELPMQLIHRDLHPANMLFEQDQVTGFIDFEIVVRGPRIFDVCYCGTSLLVSGFPDTEKMQAWPALFHSLLKGYQAVCALHHSELQALHGTLAAIELLFAAFSFETQAEETARCNISVLKWLSTSRDLMSVSRPEDYVSSSQEAS